MENSTQASSDQPNRSRSPARLRATILHASWLAVILGIIMELFALIATIILAKRPSPAAILLESARQICWSVFVCGGLAAGSALPGNPVRGMSLAGLLSAPISFALSRSVQKGLSNVLSLPLAKTAMVIVWTTGFLKTIEYLLLGLLLGRLKQRHSGITPHLLTGFLIGLIAAAILLSVNALFEPQPASTPALVARALNEIIFPVGCSAVIYITNQISLKLTTGAA